MKRRTFAGIVLLIFISIQLSAQTTKPQKPVKTGNEWKMPSDVFQRSKVFANNLQKELGLDSVQTKKVYDAFLANTKPLDEIAISPGSDKEKEAKVKANKAAFDEKMKAIFSPGQYNKYHKMETGKK